MRYFFKEQGSPTKVIAGAIYIYENLVTNWKEIIDSIENEVKEPDSFVKYDLAATIDGRTDGRRRNKILHLTAFAERGNEACRLVHNFFALTLEERLRQYAKHFETSFGEHEYYGLLKYEGANLDHYDAHYDGGPDNNRWISAILYLNDDYENGELEFVHFNEKYKPKAGTLIIFPSNYAYAHIAHSVTKGTKYAIVTWIPVQ